MTEKYDEVKEFLGPEAMLCKDKDAYRDKMYNEVMENTSMSKAEKDAELHRINERWLESIDDIKKDIAQRMRVKVRTYMDQTMEELKGLTDFYEKEYRRHSDEWLNWLRKMGIANSILTKDKHENIVKFY